MDQLEDDERKAKLTEAEDQYRRLEVQSKEIADREVQIKVHGYNMAHTLKLRPGGSNSRNDPGVRL